MNTENFSNSSEWWSGDYEGNFSIGNDTLLTHNEPLPKWRQALLLVLKYLSFAILTAIMVSVGCSISLQRILMHLRRPWGIFIGIVCQFALLPAVAFATALAVSLEGHLSVGLLIIATCPGGPMSNLYSLWFEGDVSLSITMTTLATLLAMGMMPLNLWVYSRNWLKVAAVIPYKNIILTLVITLIPVAMGYIITWKKPDLGEKIKKILARASLLAIVLSQGLTLFLVYHLLHSDWALWVASFAVPAIGFCLGFTAAYIVSKRDVTFAKTVAFETGIQSVPTAQAVILLSFGGQTAEKFLAPPILYTLSTTIEGVLVIVLYQFLWKRLWKGSKSRRETKKKEKTWKEAVEREELNKEHGFKDVEMDNRSVRNSQTEKLTNGETPI